MTWRSGTCRGGAHLLTVSSAPPFLMGRCRTPIRLLSTAAHLAVEGDRLLAQLLRVAHLQSGRRRMLGQAQDTDTHR